LGCIGAPIFEQEGSVTGVISISGAPHQVLGVRIEVMPQAFGVITVLSYRTTAIQLIGFHSLRYPDAGAIFFIFD